MTRRTDELKLDAPFSPALNGFLADMAAADWPSHAPSCLFIRDFEDLPRSAPFDIDLICAPGDWGGLRTLIRDCAGAHDLLVADRGSDLALHILVLDVAGPADKRRHAFFEVRPTLALPAGQFAVAPKQDISLAPGEVPRATSDALPVPEPAWQCAFLYLQALRKPDTGKYLRRTEAFEPDIRAAAINLLTATFGFPRDPLESWCASPVPRSGAALAQTTAAQTGFRERLRALCVDRLFFLPLLQLDFFTIHGPDGVGKSTTCAAVGELFRGLPVGLYQFHHSEGWKEGRRRDTDGKRAAVAKPAADNPAPVSPLRRMARTVYRLLPRGLKEFWLWNSHFVNYNRKFSRFVYENRNSGNILFADRYVYDVRIKYIVETERPSWLVRGYYRLHCALVPRPRFGFVLVDEPAAIVARKDELTEDQVRRFIGWITRILEQRRVQHIVIPVAGRTPRAIACEIARALLIRQGDDLIGHMRTFVTRLEAADAETGTTEAPDAAAQDAAPALRTAV